MTTLNEIAALIAAYDDTLLRWKQGLASAEELNAAAASADAALSSLSPADERAEEL